MTNSLYHVLLTITVRRIWNVEFGFKVFHVSDRDQISILLLHLENSRTSREARDGSRWTEDRRSVSIDISGKF